MSQPPPSGAAPPPPGPPRLPGPPTGPAVTWLAPPPEYAVATGPDDALRYHRLVRERGGAWWRLIVSLFVGAAGLVIAPVVAVVAILLVARLAGVDFQFDLNDGLSAGEMLGVNLGLAALIPVSSLTYWGIYRRRPRWLGSVLPGLRAPWLVRCFGMALVVWALLMLLVVFAAVSQRETPFDSGVVWLLVVIVLTTPLQAGGEEYLFRGLLLQGLGAARFPTWMCCVVSGSLFATAHLQFSPPLFADRFVLGVLLAWLAIRTGGLEAGIAIHAVKNWAGLIPAALLDKVSQTLEPTGVTWLPLGVDVVLLAIVLPWLVVVVRRRERQGLQTTLRTHPEG